MKKEEKNKKKTIIPNNPTDALWQKYERIFAIINVKGFDEESCKEAMPISTKDYLKSYKTGKTAEMLDHIVNHFDFGEVINSVLRLIHFLGLDEFNEAIKELYNKKKEEDLERLEWVIDWDDV